MESLSTLPEFTEREFDYGSEEYVHKEWRLASVKIKKFSDGEIFVKLKENIRGEDVFIIQSLVNSDSIMELLLLMDACRRASVNKMNIIIPYYAYARQDRKNEPRVAISAKVIAKHIEAAGADRIIVLDLHADQIGGFFEIPVDHLHSSREIVTYLLKQDIPDLTIVSPDAGSAERARYYAKKLNGDSNLAIIDKRRPKANVSEVMNILGDVKDKNCIIIDDMIDTAGTICKAADAIMEAGAKSVRCAAVHAVLSGPAVNRLKESAFKEIIITDTYPVVGIHNFKTISVSNLIAQAISRIYRKKSVSQLFL